MNKLGKGKCLLLHLTPWAMATSPTEMAARPPDTLLTRIFENGVVLSIMVSSHREKVKRWGGSR